MMLSEFLKAQCAAAGRWNCSTLPADWCIAQGWPDFAAAWRHVDDPADCEAVASGPGGLTALWGQGIGDALPVVDGDLEPGDIAVITVHGFEAGAIFTGERFALRNNRGLLFASPASVTVTRAWRPCPRR